MSLHPVEVQADERLCPDPCSGPCDGCPDRIICHCLKVTEETVVNAIRRLGLRTINDVRYATEAGDGCTCCHVEIRQLIALHCEPAECRVA